MGCAGSWVGAAGASAGSASFAAERLRSASPARAAFTYFDITSRLRAVETSFLINKPAERWLRTLKLQKKRKNYPPGKWALNWLIMCSTC